jgi:hypothetical protein
MFGLFKPKKDLFLTLIEQQTAFSVNGVNLHKNLISATPNVESAIIEAFLFNNWASYHLISSELCSTISASAPQNARISLRESVRLAIVTSARDIGIPDLEKKFSVKYAKYCEGEIYTYTDRNLLDYDNSVERHSTEDWHSAAIALHAKCGLAQIAVSDFNYYKEHLLKETAQIYASLEDLVIKDTQKYIRQRK